MRKCTLALLHWHALAHQLQNEEDEEETNIYLGEGAKITPSHGSITVKKIREFYGNNSGVVLSLESIPKSMDRQNIGVVPQY